MCKKYGHIRSDHEAPVSFKQEALSSDDAIINDSKSAKSSITVTFTIVKLLDEKKFDKKLLWNIIDDGGSYRRIVLQELMISQLILLPNWIGKLQHISEELQCRPLWQYGNVEHSSECRIILGSIVLCGYAVNGNIVSDIYIIIGAFSAVDCSRNFKKMSYIEHIGVNRLWMPAKSDSITLISEYLHCYIPEESFDPEDFHCYRIKVNNKVFRATDNIRKQENPRP